MAGRLTQEEVAHRLRRPQPFVFKYKTGERRPGVIELIEFFEAIGIDIRKLMAELMNVL